MTTLEAYTDIRNKFNIIRNRDRKPSNVYPTILQTDYSFDCNYDVTYDGNLKTSCDTCDLSRQCNLLDFDVKSNEHLQSLEFQYKALKGTNSTS